MLKASRPRKWTISRKTEKIDQRCSSNESLLQRSGVRYSIKSQLSRTNINDQNVILLEAGTMKHLQFLSQIPLMKYTLFKNYNFLPCTFKTYDFRPHVNFGFFSRRACHHQNASFRKRNKMILVEELKICKFGSVYFSFMIHPKKQRNLQNGPKFP